jgi:hypothetical protein
MEQKKKTTAIFKVGVWYLFILGAFAGYTNWLPQYRGEVPGDVTAGAGDLTQAPPDKLAHIGKIIVFGTDNPQFGTGTVPIGKGQCPLCHMFFTEQKADRCPNLIGEEARSENRPKEDRYKMFAARYATNPEPDSGIHPHAKPGGEYLVESEYCPSCYVVEGYGVKGTNDLQSPMPRINKPPIGLSDIEIVSVVSFLQSKDTPGDFSKVTAKASWEDYWGKKLTAPTEAASTGAPAAGGIDATKIALPDDTPEQIVQKMACFACHKIPTLAIAKTGMIGPLLIEKTNAPNRIKSPEYLKAVKAGKAHATTPKEYVMESIMHPDAFIVPGFADDMLKDFSKKFTFAALEKMADFLLTLDANTARKEGLDRLPNEKEGSLNKKAEGPRTDKNLNASNASMDKAIRVAKGN